MSYRVSYRRIRGDEEQGSTSILKPEGLFKIEGSNPIYGERVCWNNNYYRFKHLISGRYLSVDVEKGDSYCGLEKEPDQKTMFMFVPVQTEATGESRFVKKDSYYKLQTMNGFWLRLPIHTLSEKNMLGDRKLRVKFDLKTSTHIDTLRVNTCHPDEAREKPFLLAAYPIIIEMLMALGSLNQQLQDYLMTTSTLHAKEKAAKIQYDKFNQAYQPTMGCLKSLIEYLVNKSPSNISMTEEFGSISPARQKVLVDMKIAKMTIILVDNLFPFLDLMTEEKRIFVRQHSHNGIKEHDNENRLVHERQELENYCKRVDVLGLAMDIIRLVSTDNAPIQIANSLYLGKLLSGLSLSRSALSAMTEVVKNNEKILMEYSKIKKVGLQVDQGSPRSGGSRSPKSPRSPRSPRSEQITLTDKVNKDKPKKEEGNFGFEFFEEIALRMRLYPRYTQEDFLAFLEVLCQTEDKSFYLNQNNIFEVITAPENLYDMFIQIKTTDTTLQVMFTTDNLERKVCPVDTLFSEPEFDKQSKFFKRQLSLYAALSNHRNTITSAYFRDSFPLSLLVSFVGSPTVPDDYKAVFLRLIVALYVDSPPRRELDLPTVIRVYAQQSNTQVSIPIQRLPTKKGGNAYLDAEQQQLMSPDPSSPVHKGNLSEHQKEVLLIHTLQIHLIKDIEERAAALRQSHTALTQFYNPYTLEMLSLVDKLFRFEGDNGHLERVVRALAYPLEFDPDYHPSLLVSPNKLQFRQGAYDAKGNKLVFKPSLLKKGVQNAINLSSPL